MIELKDVTKEYSKGVAALNGVSVKIEQGEFVFIVGDSGSGNLLDQVDHERIGPDIRHDHREWTESEPYEAQTYSEVQKRAWSCVPGLQTFKRQKYL